MFKVLFWEFWVQIEDALDHCIFYCFMDFIYEAPNCTTATKVRLFVHKAKDLQKNFGKPEIQKDLLQNLIHVNTLYS